MTQFLQESVSGSRLGRLGLLVLLPILSGCGGKTGTVSGKVIFKGKGLPGGTITFRPANARLNPVTVAIDPDGKYEAEVPVGEAAICVDNHGLKTEDSGGASMPILPGLKRPPQVKPEPASGESSSAPEKLPGQYVSIPEKFYLVETSGLQYTVQAGSQTHDVELK